MQFLRGLLLVVVSIGLALLEVFLVAAWREGFDDGYRIVRPWSPSEVIFIFITFSIINGVLIKKVLAFLKKQH